MKNQPILLSAWPRKNTQRTKVVAMRLTQEELEKLKETQETLKNLGTTGNISETPKTDL